MHKLSADISTVREHNLSQVLSLIHEKGAISRAAIVRQTGLSATTVSALVGILLDSGFVCEAGEGKSSGGRRPILVQFNYQFRYVIGVDLGASHITTVVVDLQSTIAARRHEFFDAMNNPDGAIDIIQGQIAQVLQEANLELSVILGIGIAAPAPLEGKKLDRLSGMILPAWEGRDLAEEIRQKFELPVYLDNDANAGAIAEKWWGGGRGVSSLAYIKLGTGVGSGLIINDKIYRGSGGTAGEIGHTTINENGPLCRCGNYGCMESYVGSPAIIAEVARQKAVSSPDELSRNEMTVGKIAVAALNGDSVCRKIVQTAGVYLGIAIANLLNLVNPELVVLGGELVVAGDLLLDAVRSTAFDRAIPKAAREATIAISELKDDTVAIGAATLTIHHAFQPSGLPNILN